MKRTVVVIDDSKFLVKMLVDFFQEKMGYEVLASGYNGNHAVELYRQHRPDLLTLDLTMPVKDGLTALVEILTGFPDAKILIISAITDSTILECLKRGAKGFIEKPLRTEEDDFVLEFRTTLDEILGPQP